MGAIHRNVSKTAHISTWLDRSFVFLVFLPCQRPVVRTQRSWAWTRQPPSCSTSCSRPEREVSAASLHAGHTSGLRFGWSENLKKERKKSTPCIYIYLYQSSTLLSKWLTHLYVYCNVIFVRGGSSYGRNGICRGAAWTQFVCIHFICFCCSTCNV